MDTLSARCSPITGRKSEGKVPHIGITAFICSSLILHSPLGDARPSCDFSSKVGDGSEVRDVGQSEAHRIPQLVAELTVADNALDV